MHCDLYYKSHWIEKYLTGKPIFPQKVWGWDAIYENICIDLKLCINKNENCDQLMNYFPMKTGNTANQIIHKEFFT